MTTTIRGTDNSAAAPALTGNDSDTGVYFPADNTLGLVTGGSEAVRVDSSGNLLVGMSSSSSTASGVRALASGTITATRDGATVGVLNRLTSDGDILDFRKDTTTVGSIGSLSDHLYIGKGDTGLRFIDSLECVEPFNTSTPTLRDNAIDLGRSAARFKDLYLGGSVYLGGTGAANALDDYEEGTFTPVFSIGGTSNDSGSGWYTKIGRVVYWTAYHYNETWTRSGSGAVTIAGLPFTSANITFVVAGGGGYAGYKLIFPNDTSLSVPSNATSATLYSGSGPVQGSSLAASGFLFEQLTGWYIAT